MTVFEGQAGLAKETTWGTPVTVSRFYDVVKSDLNPSIEMIESKGIRPNRSAVSVDMIGKTNMGTTGSFEINPLTKGLGILLQLALGSVSTGTTTGGKTPHTFTVGSTAGLGFTFQHVTPYQAAAGGVTYTVAGCKVSSLTLEHAVGDILKAKVAFLGKPITTATAKATASYPASAEVFPWTTCSVTIGGVSVCGNKWSLEHNNALKSLKDATKFCGLSEPTQNDFLDGSFSLSGVNLEDTTHVDRILSTAAAGVAVVITMTGVVDTAATLVITIPAAVPEGDLAGLDSGNLAIEQDLKFKIRTPSAGGSPISIVYTTTDVTP